MFSNNNFISLKQLKLLLILDIFGMGITTLPRKLAEYGGQNGFLILIISLSMAFICLFIINKLASLFPNESFYSYTSKIVGKYLAFLISLLFVLKIIISVSFELRIFSEILKEIMLFNTPFWVTSLTMLFLSGYMASKGYETRGRIAEILIYIVFIPLGFVFFVSIFDVDFSNLKPFLKEIDFKKMLNGSIYTLFNFSALEFILLVYPYLKNKDKNQIKNTTKNGLLFVGIILLLISIITIARFGKYDIIHQMWPVLEMMDTIDLPGSFIERQDAFIMTFWIISIFMIVNSSVFFSSLILKDTIKKGTHTMYICLIIPIIYLISLIPKNIGEIYNLMDIFHKYFGILYLFLIPLILLIVAKVRGIKFEKN